MISFFNVLAMYMFSIFLFFNSSNSLMLWVTMELNLLSFLFLIFYSGMGSFNENKEMSFFYFLIQSLGSFIFILSFFLDFFMNSNYILLSLGLILKLGIFPLFFWMYKLGGSLSSFILISLLTLQKVPIFFIIFSQTSYILNLIFMIFSFLSGMVFIFFSYNLIYLLISSSISGSFYIYLMYLNSINFYFFYFFIYFFFLLVLLLENKKENYIFSILVFSFMCGLPPLSIFLFKFFMNFIIFDFFSLFNFLIFWVFSFLCLIGYIKFFFFNFFFDKFLYFKCNFCFKKMSFLIITFFFSFPLVF